MESSCQGENALPPSKSVIASRGRSEWLTYDVFRRNEKGEDSLGVAHAFPAGRQKGGLPHDERDIEHPSGHPQGEAAAPQGSRAARSSHADALVQAPAGRDNPVGARLMLQAALERS